MKKLSALLIVMVLSVFVIRATPAFCAGDEPLLLAKVKQQIAAEFGRIDASLRKSAKTIEATGLTGDRARAALAGLCSGFDYAVDCAAVDLNGNMVTIEPAHYKKFEGKYIGGQEQVKQVMKTGKPVLSNVFRAVEGFDAADVEYPVMKNGKLLGSVSLLFRPEKLLGGIIVPAVKGGPMAVWVMDENGRILYDVDQPQIGLNLFKSRLYRPYASLVKLGRRIASNPEGEGFYRFRDTSTREIVRKNAFWRSAALYGTKWRLVAIHVEQGKSGKKAKLSGDAPTPADALEAFVSQHSLSAILASDDKIGAMKLFQDFYETTPGIYSVQWVDERGINRFGYPKENSLTDYDYNRMSDPERDYILKVLADRKPYTGEARLLEGRTGLFTFRPVFDKDRYLGLVYIIRLK
jgi:hypothetical protein